MAKSKPTTDGISRVKKSKNSQPVVLADKPKKTKPDQAPSKLPEPSEIWELPKNRVPWIVRWTGWAILFVVGLFIAVTIAYSGKALPGVSVDGAKISGLGSDAATTMVNQHISDFSGQLIPISYGSQTAQLSVANLNVTYDVPKAVAAAIAYGHSGSLLHRSYETFRALLGRSTNVSIYNFDDGALTSVITPIDSATYSPVSDASFNFSGGSVTVNQEAVGHALNIGYLVLMVEDRISQTSNNAIAAPISNIVPNIDTKSLQAVSAKAASYLTGPITLNLPTGGSITVDQNTIVGWIKIARASTKQFTLTDNIADLYPLPQPVTVSLDDSAISSYVTNLAGQIDKPGKNAVLSWQNNALTVVTPSQTGQALDQAGAKSAIENVLLQSSGDRTVSLNVKVSQPDVNENNLASLGIKELISEGATTFPGSIADRISNIEVGTSKFNGVLIKPGDTFSFDSYLGNIDAADGWKPGLAIVGNQIIPEYGGGICQVSSTMYRAALLAGLPITERVNHAYAISWYTSPYGVPGVDATIYSPQVDLRFVNDTGSWILIQPQLNVATSSLKFDFYGTKTKVGVIRGPYFVSGSNDATKPSTTVFYRDVQDLSGNVLKTDTVTTHYASSLDFTHVTLD
ncbi:MAG: VanW family protein [Candidatus Saccharimonadia bacterium]